MKRFLAAGILAAVALTIVASVAQAWAPFAFTVPFRYQRGINSSQVTLNAWDSTVTAIAYNNCVTAAGVYTVASDTTVAVDTRGWSYHGPYGSNWFPITKASLADTIHAFTVFIQTKDRFPVATDDSVVVRIQYSIDAVTWAECDTLGPGLSTGYVQSLAAVGVKATPMSTTQGGNIGYKRINWDRAAANFIRFIVNRSEAVASPAVIELSVAGRKEY